MRHLCSETRKVLKMPSFNFGYDPKYTEIETQSELRVEVEFEMISSEGDLSVEFVVINQDTGKVIDFDSMDLRDRALIADRAHTPSDRELFRAMQDYNESKQPQYDKYAGL
jgi:hypothetical protein